MLLDTLTDTQTIIAAIAGAMVTVLGSVAVCLKLVLQIAKQVELISEHQRAVAEVVAGSSPKVLLPNNPPE